MPSGLISNLCCWLEFSHKPKKELTSRCFYCCSLPHSKEAYLLLYRHYYSWPEYAGRSITINHVHDLDLELSPKRCYWGWHIVLLNPDMSWLILWWESSRSLLVDCHREWLHARCLTRGVGARVTRLRLNGCQVMCTLWKVVHWGCRPSFKNITTETWGMLWCHWWTLDISRLQSGTPKEVVLMNYSAGERYHEMTRQTFSYFLHLLTLSPQSLTMRETRDPQEVLKRWISTCSKSFLNFLSFYNPCLQPILFFIKWLKIQDSLFTAQHPVFILVAHSLLSPA